MGARLPVTSFVLLFAAAAWGCASSPRVSGSASGDATVRVHTVLHDDMFPRAWSRPGIRARATPLPPHRRAQARAAVERAIARYPSGLVASHVTRIYLVRDLTFAGIRAGGTNSRRRVYVAEPRAAPADRERQWRRLFHAELSSVLLRAHRGRFDARDWAAANIAGFRYGTSSHAAVRRGLDDIRPNHWTLKQGFLYEYAMSTVENDFNSFAGYLFTDPETLYELAARYAGIAHKLERTVRFYEALGVSIRSRP